MSLIDYADTVKATETILRDWNNPTRRKYDLQEIMPFWEQLTELEQDLLRARYIDGHSSVDLKAIAKKDDIPLKDAVNKSSDALKRLSKLIFW